MKGIGAKVTMLPNIQMMPLVGSKIITRNRKANKYELIPIDLNRLDRSVYIPQQVVFSTAETAKEGDWILAIDDSIMKLSGEPLLSDRKIVANTDSSGKIFDVPYIPESFLAELVNSIGSIEGIITRVTLKESDKGLELTESGEVVVLKAYEPQAKKISSKSNIRILFEK